IVAILGGPHHEVGVLADPGRLVISREIYRTGLVACRHEQWGDPTPVPRGAARAGNQNEARHDTTLLCAAAPRAPGPTSDRAPAGSPDRRSDPRLQPHAHSWCRSAQRNASAVTAVPALRPKRRSATTACWASVPSLNVLR